jgi:hypothetical protein
MKKAGRSVCFAYNLHGVDRGGLRKTPLFSQLFLCLSRACLGKMFGLYINGAKSGVFLTVRRFANLRRRRICPFVRPEGGRGQSSLTWPTPPQFQQCTAPGALHACDTGLSHRADDFAPPPPPPSAADAAAAAAAAWGSATLAPAPVPATATGGGAAASRSRTVVALPLRASAAISMIPDAVGRQQGAAAKKRTNKRDAFSIYLPSVVCPEPVLANDHRCVSSEQNAAPKQGQ